MSINSKVESIDICANILKMEATGLEKITHLTKDFPMELRKVKLSQNVWFATNHGKDTKQIKNVFIVKWKF